MAQHLAYALNVDPFFNAARRVSVTKRVIATLSDTAPAQDRLEVVLIGARLHRLVRSARQNIRILRQTCDCLLQIFQCVRGQRHRAHRRIALWRLDDKLCLFALFDTLYRTFNAKCAVYKVNIGYLCRADFTEPRAAVRGKNNTGIFVVSGGRQHFCDNLKLCTRKRLNFPLFCLWQLDVQRVAVKVILRDRSLESRFYQNADVPDAFDR